MNKYQRVVIVVGLMNILIVLLFPPFASQSLAKVILPSFDGFYPLFSQLGKKPIFTALLSLELMFIGINILGAWIALQKNNSSHSFPDFSFKKAIAWFTVGNLLVLFSFPPFETYQTLLRFDAGGFDSFYFIFGRRSQPPIFWPLLYLECLLVVINALGFILLFSVVRASDDELRQILKLQTKDLTDGHPKKNPDDLLRCAEANPDLCSQPLGRRTERRRESHPFPASEERRIGEKRRAADSDRSVNRIFS